MAAKANTKHGILPGYFESLQQKESEERYIEKLKSIEGQDPHEISRKEWIDDVDCWPDVTYINVGMYLLFAASPYTQELLSELCERLGKRSTVQEIRQKSPVNSKGKVL